MNPVVTLVLAWVVNHLEVLHNSCNTSTHGLPNMSTLSPWACGPSTSGGHIRQATHAHVTIIK